MSYAYFAERSKLSPRHRIAFSRSGAAALRNVLLDRDGRFLVVGNGQELMTVRLSFYSYVQPGENIVLAEECHRGVGVELQFGPTNVDLGLSTPADGVNLCGDVEVAVRTTFNTGESRVDRILFRHPNRISDGVGFSTSRGMV